MKACFKCGRSLPLSEFYPHPRMGDGHLNKCKDCTKRDVKRDYIAKVATLEGLESERRRGRDKYHRLYQSAYEWTAPEAPSDVKERTHNALGNAVRDGRVVKPEACSRCGADGRIHGHHTDYYKPFDVMWLCPRCHRAQHRKERT